MSSGIYSALSGAIAQERSLSVVANNVANANTTGFKADRVAFDEALAQQNQAAAARSGELKYTAINRVEADLSAGSTRLTGNDLDFALQGDGYFTIQTPAGERFTRNGAFVMDADGIVRTQSGHALLAETNGVNRPGRTLQIPQDASAIALGEDGTLMVDGAQVGKLKLVRFANPDDVEKEGLTLFKPKQGATPLALDGGSVIQGSLETSNVNAVSGVNELITVSRAFDALQKVIQTFRDIDNRAARDLGSR